MDGCSWLKRKAIGAALSLGLANRNYTIKVITVGDAFSITITDGKRDNTIPTDGSQFEYEAATGKATTTAQVVAGKVVMTTAAYVVCSPLLTRLSLDGRCSAADDYPP
jgi:hypothetical protein